MTPGIDRAQAREWLDAQIAELGSLRNASPRDSAFRQWRQHTLTQLERIWSEDSSKASRFKRIPFTAPGPKPEREQVRIAYGRGCGEALACLRALRSELDRTPDAAAGAGRPDAPRAGAPRPAADPPGVAAAGPGSAPPQTPTRPEEHEAVRQAMSDFLSSSPVFAALDRMERDRGTTPRLSPSAFALAALASELADLGVPAIHRTRARNALSELAQHIDRRDLTWDELRDAVGVMMEFRSLARRVLPLLLPFLDEAA